MFRSEGKKRVERTFILRERDKTRVEHIVMEPAPVAEPVAPEPAKAVPMPWPTVKPSDGSGSAATPEAPVQGRALTPLFFVAGGAAVVGLGFGIAAGVASSSKHSALEGECNGNACPPSARGDIDAFHTLRTVSTIGYVVGALGLAGGAYFFFTAPRRPAQGPAARLEFGPASVHVAGDF